MMPDKSFWNQGEVYEHEQDFSDTEHREPQHFFGWYVLGLTALLIVLLCLT